jgi:hypothetical protein
MDYAQSNLAIVDAPLVNIEISINPDRCDRRLRLNYHGQKYDLVQAFASHKFELAQQRLQQQIAADTSLRARSLLVRDNLGLQQASIWLFQEIWLQWQDLLGERQLQIFADNLLGVNSLLRSRADLDRLLSLDPLSSEQLGNWERADFIKFDRQLCDLTQKKMGQQFGHKLTIDIVESMPDLLRTILLDSLDLEIQSNIP